MPLALREQLVLAALTGAAVEVRRAWPTVALDEAYRQVRRRRGRCGPGALASADPPAIRRSTMHGGMVASMNYPCIVRLSDSHPTHLGCVGVATGPVGHDLIHVRFPGRGGITLAPTEGMVPGPWEPTPERIAAAQAAGVRRGDGGASRMHAAAAAAEEGEEYGTGGEYGDGSYGDCPANTEAPAID